MGYSKVVYTILISIMLYFSFYYYGCVIIFLVGVGDKRTRTANICLAKATLYQLSYTPNWAMLDSN